MDDIFVWYQYWLPSGTSQAITDKWVADKGLKPDKYNNDEVILEPGQQISVMARIFADDDSSFDNVGDIEIDAYSVDPAEFDKP